MRSKSVALTKWHTVESNSANLDVDWPRYHQEIGETCIQWLLKQERAGRCQLVVERQLSRARLAVDMFDDAMITEFHLMWSNL